MDERTDGRRRDLPQKSSSGQCPEELISSGQCPEEQMVWAQYAKVSYIPSTYS